MEQIQQGINLRLRNAGPEDLPLLQYWDRQPHVIAAAPNDDWDWETELNRDPGWRELLIAELDSRPIGMMQIIDPALEDSHYWGDAAPGLRAIDIWIGEAADLGKGYGTVMMQQAFEICFKDREVTAILIDPLESNQRARRFYERLGFSQVGPRKFDQDNCMVYQLSRDDWERVQREQAADDPADPRYFHNERGGREQASRKGVSGI